MKKLEYIKKENHRKTLSI